MIIVSRIRALVYNDWHYVRVRVRDRVGVGVGGGYVPTTATRLVRCDNRV